jgi:hypothetical protein
MKNTESHQNLFSTILAGLISLLLSVPPIALGTVLCLEQDGQMVVEQKKSTLLCISAYESTVNTHKEFFTGGRKVKNTSDCSPCTDLDLFNVVLSPTAQNQQLRLVALAHPPGVALSPTSPVFSFGPINSRKFYTPRSPNIPSPSIITTVLLI